MKKFIYILLVLILATTLVSCNKPDTNNSHTDSITIVDDLDRSVTINQPSRVATLLGSFADMWILAGGSICASADDAWEDFNLNLDSSVINLGSAHRPNKENLLSSDPDLVIASPKLSKHRELSDTLQSAGIPVIYWDVNNFNSYLEVLDIMTDITGNKANFTKYGTDQQTAINAILARNQNKPAQSVLVLRASASSIRAKNSTGTMLGGMLQDFGCINIADSNSMLLEQLNIESIVELNPAKVFLVQTGDDLQGIENNVNKMFDENPLWKQLTAYKTNQIYYMDKHLYNLKPNAKFTLAYQNLERILNGEQK